MTVPDQDEAPTERQRYEMALDALKQAANRLVRAKRRSDKHLVPYEADVDRARLAFDAAATRTSE